MTRLGSRLDREWSQLRSRPALLRHAAGWAIVEGPLHDLDQILAAVGYQVAWTARNEAAMRELVLRAADDELAARIAIQRILPGLLAVVRRRGAADEDGLDELIGAAWIGVRTFNPARRSRCVAAALIADADYRAFRSRWRRRCAGERPDRSHARTPVRRAGRHAGSGCSPICSRWRRQPASPTTTSRSSGAPPRTTSRPSNSPGSCR